MTSAWLRSRRGSLLRSLADTAARLTRTRRTPAVDLAGISPRMKTTTEVIGLFLALATALSQLRNLLHRPGRELPAERQDDLVVVGLTTDAVVHPLPEAVRRERRNDFGMFLLSAGFLAFAVVTLLVPGEDSGIPVPFFVGEAIVAMCVFGYRVLIHRQRRDGEPVDTVRASIRVTASFDALTARLRRAFLTLHAFGVCGSSVSSSDDGFVIEGGTGDWVLGAGAGHRLRATATRAGDEWEVTVESMNYVPSLTQNLRNSRNVGRVMRALLV